MNKVKYIAAGFIEDAEKLLNEFWEEKSPEFPCFIHFWKKHNFAAVYLGRSEAELQQFTQEIFQLTLRYLDLSDVLQQIGGVYLLYALFRNQIVEPPTRIRVILNQYKKLMDLRELATNQKYKALHYVIGYLMEHGFDYAANPILLGPRNANNRPDWEMTSVQMAWMLKDFEVPSVLQTEKNTIEEIKELSRVYAEAIQETPMEFTFQGASELDLNQQLEKLFKLAGVDMAGYDLGSDSQREEEQDNIGSRRAAIKSNAFSSKALFRHLNATDDEEEAARGGRRRTLSRKAKLQKELAENSQEEESGKEVKRRKILFKKKKRLPVEQRRVGRPRKGQEMERLLTVVEDISDVDEYTGSRRRGPVSKTTCLDPYDEPPFTGPTAEMISLSSSSEEEEEVTNNPIDEGEEEIANTYIKKEKIDDPPTEDITGKAKEDEAEGILTF